MAEKTSPPPSSSPEGNSNHNPPPTKSYELTAVSIYYAKPASRFLYSKACTASSPIKPAFILRDVSLIARPGELLAVVGPSGAGKSTLLDILSARLAPTLGALLLNSRPLRPPSFRRISAHVPQHDLFLPLLTVLESFAFAAALLPSPQPSSAVSLLADLGLSHLAHTRLSSALSGGERRRISIGLSLLRLPSLLLLDEPTSGLDSASALSLVRSLRSLAQSRRTTVVLSVHQPSSKLLSSVNSILLLSNGSVVHHGSLASLDAFLLSAGFTVPQQLNPLEYAMEILPQLPTTTPTAITSPPLPKISLWAELTSYVGVTASADVETRYGTSRAREIVTLYLRFCKIVYRSKQLLLTNTLEALIVGSLLGTIYIRAGYDKQGMEKRLGFFAFTLTFLLSSTTETLPIFVTERPILLREASSGMYRLSSHLVANTLVFVPYLLVVAILYSSSVYFLVGLCTTVSAFAGFVMIVWLVVLTANSFVLFVSSVAPDYIAGTSLVTVSLAGFFLFSGYFISRESMPGFWKPVHYLSPYKYALDAMLANEYGCVGGRCFEWGTEGCAVTGRDVLEKRGIGEEERWGNLRMLFGFFVFYRVLYWIVLTRRASISKK